MVPRHTSRAIDVMRGVAALGVIWGHSVDASRWPIDLNGAYWVWIFLVLSGYLVAKGFEPERYGRSLEGYARFLWNRGLRIVPLAWIALALGAVLEAVGTGGRTSTMDALRQFAFLPNQGTTTLSGPMWTVAAEVQFYVVAAILCWPLLRVRDRRLVWACWIASVYLAWRTIPALNDSTAQPRTLVGNLPFFIFGIAVAAGEHDARIETSRTLKVLLVLALTAVAWYLQNWRSEYFWAWGPHRAPYGGAAVCALIAAAVVLVTKVPARPEFSSIVEPSLAWCGFHTYGIYVYHSVLTKANSTVIAVSPGIWRLGLLLLSVVIAPLSYRWIEQPLLSFKRSTSRRRVATAASAPAATAAL